MHNLLLSIAFILALSACGGSGGTDNPVKPVTPPPQKDDPSKPFSSFEQFNRKNGALPAKVSIATLESLIQLGYMAKEQLTAVAKGKSLACQRGSATLVEQLTKVEAGTQLTVQFDSCFDYIIGDPLEGKYKINVTSIADGRLDFVIDLNELKIKTRVDGVEAPISFTGRLNIQSQVDYEQELLKVSLPNNNQFSFFFSTPKATEKVTALSVTKLINYLTGRFIINGDFAVTSGLAKVNYTTRFISPLSGVINSPADAGQILVKGGRSDLRISARENAYQIDVDLNGDGSFETPPTKPVSWNDLIEGALFYDKNTASSKSPETTVFNSPNEIFKVEDLIGYHEKISFGNLVVLPKDQLKFRLTRPIDKASEVIAKLRPNGENAITVPLKAQGMIITVDLDIKEYKIYNLQLELKSIDGDTLKINEDLKTIKPILAIVEGNVISSSGENLTLNAKSLSRSLTGDIVNYNWKQLAGPKLSFEANQPILDLTIPAITKSYEEASLLLEITDNQGFSTNTEFRLLIVSKQLNRHIVYIPFENDPNKRVLLAKNNQIFIEEKDSNFFFDYDPHILAQTGNVYARVIVTKPLSEGETVLFGESVTASLTTTWRAGIELKCVKRYDLGEIAKGVSDVVFYNLQRDERNKISKLNLQSGRYCTDHGQFRTEVAIMFKPELYSVTQPGFIFTGKASPISIAGKNSNLYSVTTSDNISVVAKSNNQLQASNLSGQVNHSGEIELSANGYSEKLKLDLIGDLNNKSFIYFQKSVNRTHDKSRPNAVFSFHSLGDPQMLQLTNDHIANIKVFFNSTQHSAHVDVAFPKSGMVLNERIYGRRVLDDSATFIATAYDATVCERDGWYELLEYQTDNNDQVISLALDFYQRCSWEGTFNRGAIRLNSTIPVDFAKFNQNAE